MIKSANQANQGSVKLLYSKNSRLSPISNLQSHHTNLQSTNLRPAVDLA